MRVGVLSLAYRCNTFAKTGGRLLLGSGDSRGQDRGWLAALADPVARHSDGEVVDLGCSIPAAGGPIPGDDFAAVLQRFDRRVQDSPPLDALLVHASGTLVVGGASGEALLLQHLRTRFPSLPIGLLVDHVAQLPD
ncbi:MAG: M81 family metallopeptidase, partial [Thermomicrobium sp.]|nr:M81 family metallopeptidase [Thermomicrobium sp.]